MAKQYRTFEDIPQQLLAVWEKALETMEPQELTFDTKSQAKSTQVRLYLLRRALFRMAEEGTNFYVQSLRDAEDNNLNAYEILLRENKLIVQKAAWLRGLPKAQPRDPVVLAESEEDLANDTIQKYYSGD